MPKWDYEKDINYENINVSKIKDNEFLFFIVSISSFIEITSETYANNLIEYYKDNEEATNWLKNSWEIEEIQHGKALKRYVNTVWPEFDWGKAYNRFLESYLPLCNLEALQPSKGLEMVARMIVETGTSTFYKTLERYSNSLNEPILEKIAHYIHKDEVNHYSYFNKFYKYYNEKEKISRKDILKVIINRLKDMNDEDIELAYQAVYETLYNKKYDPKSYDLFHKEINKMANKYYPYNMAIKMMLNPLRINSIIEASMVPVIRTAMRVIGI